MAELTQAHATCTYSPGLSTGFEVAGNNLKVAGE